MANKDESRSPNRPTARYKQERESKRKAIMRFCRELTATAEASMKARARLYEHQRPLRQVVDRCLGDIQRFMEGDAPVTEATELFRTLEDTAPPAAVSLGASERSATHTLTRQPEPASLPGNAHDPSSTKRKVGRPHKTHNGFKCESWMSAIASEDKSACNWTGRQWAKKGPWKSPRTYEETDLFQAWLAQRRKQESEAADLIRQQVSDRCGEIEESVGIRVGRKKNAIGKHKRSRADRKHDNDVEYHIKNKLPWPDRKE